MVVINWPPKMSLDKIYINGRNKNCIKVEKMFSYVLLTFVKISLISRIVEWRVEYSKYF